MASVLRRKREALPPPPAQHFGLFLTAARAALYLGIAESTFHLWRKVGGFPEPVEVPCRVADRVRLMWRREDLRSWSRSLGARSLGNQERRAS